MRWVFLSAVLMTWGLVATKVVAGCDDLDRQALDIRLMVTDATMPGREAYLNPVGDAAATPLHIVLGSGEGGKTLTVRRTEKPIAVMLVTGTGVWRVIVEEGARLARLTVLVQGNVEDVELRGLPPEVKTERLPARCIATHQGWPNFQKLYFLTSLSAMRDIAGQVEASFQEVRGNAAVVPLPAGDPPGKQVAVPAIWPEPMQDRQFAEPKDLIAFLERAIERKVLPADLPRFPPSIPTPSFMPLLPGSQRIEAVQRVRLDRECRGILKGTADRDYLQCHRGAAVYFAGAGDDIIESNAEYRIIDAGAGNDEIRLHGGTAVIVFPLGWGHDRLSGSSGEARYNAVKTGGADKHRDFAYPWANFIVFGEGIQPADLEWMDEKKLRHRTNGDVLEINDEYWNVVFFDALGIVWDLKAEKERIKNEQIERQRAANRENRKNISREDREAAERERMLKIFREMSDEAAIQYFQMRAGTLANAEGTYRNLTMDKVLETQSREPVREIPAVAQQRLTVLPPGVAECEPARASDYCVRLRPVSREACEDLLRKPLRQTGTRVGTAPMVDSFLPKRQAFPADACASAAVIIWRYSGGSGDRRFVR